MDWTWILIGTAAGAAVMFFWLGLCWTTLPHHKADFKGVPNPEGLDGPLSDLKAGEAIYCYPFMGDYAGGQNDPELKKAAQIRDRAVKMVTVTAKSVFGD